MDLAGFQTAAQSVLVDGQLILEAIDEERQVKRASDTTFELKMANLAGSDLPVTVTEVVVLPPYFEQGFQIHVFVDERAGRGQRGALNVRVEPQTAGVVPRSVTLSAEVVN